MHLPADPADVASIDAIITAAYDVISGPAGQKRDWDRERSLFIPGACLIPTTRTAGEMNRDGTITPQLLDVDSYIERSRDYLEKNGFFEGNCPSHRGVRPTSLMSGAPTSRATRRTIHNRSCAGSTAFSCSMTTAVGGSSRSTGSTRALKIRFQRSISSASKSE
jgi:hypothetical protein